MHALLQDLLLSLRHFRHRPGFAALAVLTLALGIGASAAIFSVVDAVLLRDLPYQDPERLVLVDELDPSGKKMPLAAPNLDDLAARHRGFASLARYSGGTTLVTSGAHAARTGAYAVAANLMDVFAVRPERGAGFVAGATGASARTALVSHRFWRDVLGAPEDLSAVTLSVFGESLPVAGVMPDGFHFPADANVWLPAEIFPDSPSRTAHNWQAVGRLRPDLSFEQAQADALAIGQGLQAQFGSRVDLAAFGLTRLHDAVVGPVRPILLALLGGVGFLLLVAGSNVANLFLAQALARRKELAVRAALGAGRARLIRQFVMESVLLSLAGAALGVIAAQVSLEAMLALIGDDLPRAQEISIDGRTLAATLVVTLLASVAIGFTPALRGGGLALAPALNDQNRGGTVGRTSARLRDLLVVAQGAMTVVLLVGAGLLGRTFVGLINVDPGFAPEGAVSVGISTGGSDDAAGAAQRVAELGRVMERLSALPGVTAAGGVDALPLSGDGADGGFFDESVTDFNTDHPSLGYADYRVASAGYFRAMGIPLLRGRAFESTDREQGAHVALVSRSVAEATWPGRDPIGQRIQYGNMDGDMRLLTIVGVVGDVRNRGLDRAPRGAVYVDYVQRPAKARDFSIVLRSSGDAANLLPLLRAELPGIAPGAPVTVRTLEGIYRDSLATRRFSLSLFAIFATVALTLAASGVYSLIAFSVGERRPEIAVRLALGSTPARVQAMVLGQGLRLQVLALVIGMLTALLLARFIGTLLSGVSATDPWTFAAVGLLVFVVGALACWLPARRAAAIDPLAVLR